MSVHKLNSQQALLRIAMRDLEDSGARLQLQAQELQTLLQQLQQATTTLYQCFTLLGTLLEQECLEDELDNLDSKRLQ